MQSLEQRKVMMMLAARLGKMRVALDTSSIAEEVDALLEYEKSEKRWFKFDEGHTSNRESSERIARQWIDLVGQKMASHVVSEGDIKVNERGLALRQRVKDARSTAVSMTKVMKAFKSDARREIYLYQVRKLSTFSIFANYPYDPSPPPAAPLRPSFAALFDLIL